MLSESILWVLSRTEEDCCKGSPKSRVCFWHHAVGTHMPSKEVLFECRGRTRIWTGSEAFSAPCRRRCVLSVSKSSDKYSRHGKDLSSFEYGNMVDIGHICVESQRVFERAEGRNIKDCWFDLVPWETRRQISSLPSFQYIGWYEQSL